MKTEEVLGIKIDDVNMREALMKIEEWIWNPGKHYIVTPNPEFLVAAQEDGEFKKILNNADLSIPDGAGLKLSGKIKNTLSGTDLMNNLIRLSAEKAFTIGFLGGEKGVAERLKDCLKGEYQTLSVVFASSGGSIDNQGRGLSDPKIKIPPVDILFVAFGHIKQEKWIAGNFENTPAKVMMAVGGAFDYLSGKVPRAPRVIRNMGFEWLFRLIIQPHRIIRQMALLKYLWLLTKNR